MSKNCLIIDNENQEDNFDTIIREGHKKNVDINCFQFNVGSPWRDDLLSEGKIDIDKVISVLHREFRGLSFDLIAFDWDYDDENIDGVELIRQFKANNVCSNTPILLYSGLLKERIHSYIDNYKDPKIQFGFDDLWKKLNPLINLEIIKFARREEYEKEIAVFLSRENFDIKKIISDEIGKFPDLEFRNTYPHFKGLKLHEIQKIIEAEPSRGNVFLQEIIERSIAHMIELNQ